MKRSVLLVLGLLMWPLAGSTPVAEATGAGACTISGTMTFRTASLGAQEGSWAIEPAVISCQGLYNAYERILGPGEFSGSGTYTTLPGPPKGTEAPNSCVHNSGFGTVDYTVLTAGYDVHLTEPQDYTLNGASGTFNTTSLHGTFQVLPPYDGDCMSTPVTKAFFVAQAALVRFYPEDPTRRLPRIPPGGHR